MQVFFGMLRIRWSILYVLVENGLAQSLGALTLPSDPARPGATNLECQH